MLVRDLYVFSQTEKYYGGAKSNSTLYQSVQLLPNTTTKKSYYTICNCIILLAHVGQDGIVKHEETKSHEHNAKALKLTRV